MNEMEKKLKAQLDANTAALAKLQMQQQYQQRSQQAYEDQYGGPEQFAGEPYAPEQQGYGGADPNALLMQAITEEAAKRASAAVSHSATLAEHQKQGVKTRMERLVRDFPALAEEGSALVTKSREVYGRIAKENPGLDEATRYELAVREAASVIGARPTTISPEDDVAWTMGSGTTNPALPSKSGGKSRLNSNIIKNAAMLGINVDPKTKEGQQNLKELSEYSGRFNADQDESHFKYR